MHKASRTEHGAWRTPTITTIVLAQQTATHSQECRPTSSRSRERRRKQPSPTISCSTSLDRALRSDQTSHLLESKLHALERIGSRGLSFRSVSGVLRCTEAFFHRSEKASVSNTGWRTPVNSQDPHTHLPDVIYRGAQTGSELGHPGAIWNNSLLNPGAKVYKFSYSFSMLLCILSIVSRPLRTGGPLLASNQPRAFLSFFFFLFCNSQQLLPSIPPFGPSLRKS